MSPLFFQKRSCRFEGVAKSFQVLFIHYKNSNSYCCASYAFQHFCTLLHSSVSINVQFLLLEA